MSLRVVGAGAAFRTGAFVTIVSNVRRIYRSGAPGYYHGPAQH